MNETGRASLAALLHELDQKSPAGCAIGLHIRFTAPRYMFQSYPKRWLEEYNGTGLLLQDPTVRWGMTNVGWIRWNDLETIDEHGVLERAKNYGLMNGVAIALFIDGLRSIASFARSDRDYTTAEIAELEGTFEELHRAAARLGDLSEEDRQALKDLSLRLTH